MKAIFRLFVIGLAFIAMPAFADTYQYSGKIIRIQIVEGSMNLRVSLSSAMTNCDLDFAFVEPTSANFNLYASGLMTAYAQQKDVILQVSRESSGYCRIYFANY